MEKNGLSGHIGTPMTIEKRYVNDSYVKKKGRKRSLKKPRYSYGYKYGCINGHTRIENVLIQDRALPFCTICHISSSKMNRIQYISRIKLSKL